MTSEDTGGSRSEAAGAYHHRGDNVVPPTAHDTETLDETRAASYWRANLRLLLGLLIVWFCVSFGAGILLVDWLDQFWVFGFKLGFWFAQQGAIYTFVVLIFVYVFAMRRIDHRHGVDDDPARRERMNARSARRNARRERTEEP